MTFSAVAGRTRVVQLAAAAIALCTVAACSSSGSKPADSSSGASSTSSGAAGSASDKATNSSSAASTGSGSNASGSSSAADGVAYAKAQIAKNTALRTTFAQPGPALIQAQQALAKRALSGKTVWFIPIFQQAIQFTSEIESFTAAMKELGADVHVCDAKANPSGASACVNQAAAANPAAIVASSLNYAIAKNGFDSVIARKIPLVLVDGDETGPAALPKSDTARQMGIGGPDFGRFGADWIIADSNGKANVLMSVDDATTGAIQFAAAKNEYEQHCPGCKLTVIHYNDGSLPKLSTAVSSALIAHPEVKYIQHAYDEPSGIYAVRGVQQVRGRKVKFVAGGGSPVGLGRIHDGQQSASPGVDTAQIGWQTADIIVRYAAHVPQVGEYPSTLRLFSAQNLPAQFASADVFKTGAFYSNGGYREMYKRLWGAA